jgi:hypothetical protein
VIGEKSKPRETAAGALMLRFDAGIAAAPPGSCRRGRLPWGMAWCRELSALPLPVGLPSQAWLAFLLLCLPCHAGRAYSIWKVTDLDQTSISLFLFSDAHGDLWREAEGTILALFTPKVGGLRTRLAVLQRLASLGTKGLTVRIRFGWVAGRWGVTQLLLHLEAITGLPPSPALPSVIVHSCLPASLTCLPALPALPCPACLPYIHRSRLRATSPSASTRQTRCTPHCVSSRPHC